MVATTLNGVMLTGDHASRPAASAVAKGALYSCTTHSLVYQSDASSWSTWATLGSAASGSITSSGYTQTTARLLGRTTASTGAIEEITVGSGLTLSAGSLTASAGSIPGWISQFVGTTTSTAFYWDGNDLASFTTQTVTGSATWTEGNNLASVVLSNQSADDAAAQLIAHTFSVGDAYVLAVNMTFPMSHASGTATGKRQLGICFTDGTTTGANMVGGLVQVGNDGTSVLLVGRSGTLTAMTTAPFVSDTQLSGSGNWLWIKLIYQASNTFRLQYSPDGVSYSAFGEADISKTMTPSFVGILGMMEDSGIAIGSFGPLIKTA